MFQGKLNAGYGRLSGINPIVNVQGFPLDQQYNATSVQFGNDAEFVVLSDIGIKMRLLFKQNIHAFINLKYMYTLLLMHRTHSFI